MLVYVICAEVEWDSYHQVVLATLDKTDADKTVDSKKKQHENCPPKCGGVFYHMHTVDLEGITPQIQSLITPAADLDLLSVLSDSGPDLTS